MAVALTLTVIALAVWGRTVVERLEEVVKCSLAVMRRE